MILIQSDKHSTQTLHETKGTAKCNLTRQITPSTPSGEGFLQGAFTDAPVKDLVGY